MKNLVHCFSRAVVSAFLERAEKNSGKHFELMAALLMQRLYEKQWNIPAMIGFYLKTKYVELLKNAENPTLDLFMEALENGIDENNSIDFAIVAADESALQEFQLKRFGLNETNTEALIHYLNALKKQYAPIDAACLVAIANFELIDFLRVNSEIEKKDFPFTELLLIGVVADKFLVAGILPDEGWSEFDLSAVVFD
jgi:hypothetical protein